MRLILYFRQIIIIVILSCAFGSVYSNAEDVPAIINENIDFKSKNGVNVIEKHYYKQEIIKEVPEEKSKYEQHLFDQMQGKLKKHKRNALVWRVEGDLIEINKGSLHKVRENDVYALYDKDNMFKGKIEIGAVGDAVSVGRALYGNNRIAKDDIAKYIGQRRFWGSGLLYGVNQLEHDQLKAHTFDEYTNYEIYGLYWRFLFTKEWGIGFLAGEAFMEQTATLLGSVSDMPDEWKKFQGYQFTGLAGNQIATTLIEYEGNYHIKFPIDVRRYYFHPKWYSCYAGAGVGFADFSYKYCRTNVVINQNRLLDDRWRVSSSYDSRTIIVNDAVSKKTPVPYLTCGTEIALGRYFRVVASLYYFHGPEITVEGYKELTRPLISAFALIGTW